MSDELPSINYPLRVVKHKDGTMEWRDDDITQPSYSQLQEKLKQAHALLSHAVHKMHLRCDENREWLDKACDWLGEPRLETR